MPHEVPGTAGVRSDGGGMMNAGFLVVANTFWGDDCGFDGQ